MLRRVLLSLAAIMAALGTSSKAQGYGACHTGYTHVGPGGVQHYGSTSVSGPNGSYSGSHTSAYGAGGAYHSGSAYGTTSGGAGGAYHYTSSAYGGTAAGGYHYGTTTGGASAGVYRVGY
jgi:hypothetical protein